MHASWFVLITIALLILVPAGWHFFLKKKRMREAIMPKNQQELKELITYMSTYAHRGYPEITGLTFDSSFELLFQSLDNLGHQIGIKKCKKLADMGEQAKLHFVEGDKKLGVRLLQDVNEVLFDRKPFAYPANYWRWD